MLTPYLGAPLLALLFLLILTALGVGIASRLINGGRPALLLAPALGLALATSVLTTVSAVTPLGSVGPVALAAGAVVSLAATKWEVLGPLHQRRSVLIPALIPAGIVLTAVALALTPVLAHGTYGPANLYFMDSWFFVAADRFLKDATLNSEVVGSPSMNPTLATVASIQRAHSRLGIDALQASMFELTRTRVIAGQYPALAAYTATLGLATYGLARLGTQLSRGGAAAAAMLAVSLPITVELWVDPRPANLVAVVLGPLLLFLGARSVMTGSRREAAVAGIATSGVVVSYVEHVPTIAGVGIGLSFVGFALASARRAQYVRRLVTTATLAFAVGFVLSPPGWFRAYEYAKTLEAGVGGPPLAGLDAAAIGPLLAGTAHIYELARIPLTAPLRATLLFNLTGCALVLSAIGILTSRRTATGVAAGVYGGLVITSAALAAYFRIVGGCGDYCVQKALTLTGPAVAVTVVIGAARCWRYISSRPVPWRMALVAILLIYIGFVGRAAAGLLRGAATVPMAVDQRDFDIPDAISKLPAGAPILIEGAESVGDVAVFFDVPAAFELARSREHPLRYDRSLGGALAGGAFPGDSFRGDYRYVLTRFPGLKRSTRRTLRVFGQYALQRRSAASDVAIVASGGTRDPADAASDAIPWLRGPITLRVVGANDGIEVRVRARGPAASTTNWSTSGATIRSRPAAGEILLCLTVPPGSATRDVVLVPQGLSLPQPAREPTQELQRSPRAIGVVGIETYKRSRTGC